MLATHATGRTEKAVPRYRKDPVLLGKPLVELDTASPNAQIVGAMAMDFTPNTVQITRPVERSTSLEQNSSSSAPPSYTDSHHRSLAWEMKLGPVKINRSTSNNSATSAATGAPVLCATTVTSSQRPREIARLSRHASTQLQARAARINRPKRERKKKTRQSVASNDESIEYHTATSTLFNQTIDWLAGCSVFIRLVYPTMRPFEKSWEEQLNKTNEKGSKNYHKATYYRLHDVIVRTMESIHILHYKSNATLSGKKACIIRSISMFIARLRPSGSATRNRSTRSIYTMLVGTTNKHIYVVHTKKHLTRVA